MNIISKVQQAIDREGLLPRGARVIVATSGGADSVALLSVLHDLGYICVAAHCNFHLRGEESDRDMNHVINLCDRLGIQLLVTHFDVHTYCADHGLSLEMACRELRYDWFEKILAQEKAAAIAVAHHREDNVETFFLNLLRGTGIAGLTGMRPLNGHIIRPMLDCSRSEIEKYLSDKGLDFVTDSTNALNDFKRNRLRNVIIPALEHQFPGATDAILATMANLATQQAVYQSAVSSLKDVYFQGNIIELSRLITENANAQTLLYEWIKPLGFNIHQVKDMINSADSSGRRFVAGSTSAVINRGTLELAQHSDIQQDSIYEISLANDIEYPLTLSVKHLSISNFAPVRDNSSIYLDSNVLDGNPVFRLRHWQEGDRIKPFGMKGSQKVSDIFNNAKVSIADKSKIWLLTRNDDILWIVGLRASRLFTVSPSTRNFLQISVNLVKKDN